MNPLRQIVACETCARQFDAAGLAPKSRFRCACGALLTVPAKTSHEAAVVRCSSCGAPRQGQAAACSFCSADFTLREQDLDAICPKCFTRISSKGRFCHCCATPILVEDRAGEVTESACPVCGPERKLASRRLGPAGPAALECGVCGGLWLGDEAFRRLAESARLGEVVGLEAGVPASGVPQNEPRPAARGPMYRSCPRCGTRMNRTNYGRTSGIILDSCRPHGVWFDAHELDRLLAWVRRGGLAFAEQRRQEEEREAERKKRLEKLQEEGTGLPPMRREDRELDLLEDLGELFYKAVQWLGKDAR